MRDPFQLFSFIFEIDGEYEVGLVEGETMVRENQYLSKGSQVK